MIGDLNENSYWIIIIIIIIIKIERVHMIHMTPRCFCSMVYMVLTVPPLSHESRLQ